VDDAVLKLIDDGLVKVNAAEVTLETRLRCVTISKPAIDVQSLPQILVWLMCRLMCRLLPGRAITDLQAKWSTYFDDPEQPCPYCPYVSHGGGSAYQTGGFDEGIESAASAN
jgi:hypothetical protein